MLAHKNLLGLTVISLDNGKEIGKVKKPIIDVQTGKIIALLLEQKTGIFRDAKVITYDFVNHIGKDAVTVSKTDCIQKASSIPDIFHLLKLDNTIINSRVMTINGTALGNIEEYYFDVETGNITSLEISGSGFNGLFKGKAFLAAEYITTIGKDVIIVDNEAPHKLVNKESSLQKNFSSLKCFSTKLVEQVKESFTNLKENIKKMEEEEQNAKMDSEDNKENPHFEPEEDSNGDEENSDKIKE